MFIPSADAASSNQDLAQVGLQQVFGNLEILGGALEGEFISEICNIRNNSLPEEFSEAHARTMTAITVFILVNDWGFSHDENFHPSTPFYHFQDIRNRTLHQV